MKTLGKKTKQNSTGANVSSYTWNEVPFYSVGFTHKKVFLGSQPYPPNFSLLT